MANKIPDLPFSPAIRLTGSTHHAAHQRDFKKRDSMKNYAGWLILPVLLAFALAAFAQSADPPSNAQLSKGSIVKFTPNTMLLFQGKPFRLDRAEERFTILEVRPAQREVFVSSLDRDSREIAVSAPVASAFPAKITQGQKARRIV